uniref:Caspase 9, apoptosis-related cysteine peptidase n=1 Tax=Astatotilapia calliptera TaxID=8154 RepID=A0A3P8QAB9_ASTCA
MDEIHKNILQRNRSNLVKDLDPSKLYDGLLEKGIFTQDMIDEIQSAGTRRNQARQLVQDLETRGSRAFPLFLQCLQETGQESLAELLQNGAPAATPTQVVRPVIQPLPITSPVDGNKPGKDVEKPEIPSSSPPGGGKPRPGPGRVRRDSLQGYKMDASPCGYCLIINNMEFEPHSMLKNRKGSNIDCEKLERRFKTLNFVVEVRTNLRQKVNHNRFPGAVYGVDGQYVPVQHITNYLNGQHCPSLQGKPKLFFIQACGGDERDMGFEVSPDEVEPSSGGMDDQTDAIPMSSSSDSLSMSDEPDARPTLPTPSDILVSYSTFPGYVSWRETQSGSWYVQTLDCILEENAATVDLVTMLMMVNNEVSQNSAKGLYKQMPGSFNFLRKLLYFRTQT